MVMTCHRDRQNLLISIVESKAFYPSRCTSRLSVYHNFSVDSSITDFIQTRVYDE